MNNLITLRQQSLGFNIHKQTVMTVTIITTHGNTPYMEACITMLNLYCTLYCILHWVIKTFTILRPNIYMCPTKKRDINSLTTTQFMKPLYNTITVMPVSRSNYTDLPFNNIGNN